MVQHWHQKGMFATM